MAIYWYDNVEAGLSGDVTIDFAKAHELIQVGDASNLFKGGSGKWHRTSEGDLEKMLPKVVKMYFIRAFAEIDMSNVAPGVGMIGEKPSKEISDLVPGIGLIGHPVFHGLDRLEEDRIPFSINMQLSVETASEGEDAVEAKVDEFWETLARSLENFEKGVLNMSGVVTGITNHRVEIIDPGEPMQFEDEVTEEEKRIDRMIEERLE